ncbi:protein IMPACT-like isoform X1 [Argonauta hians]
MDETEDNLTRQVDEVEALTAIYGEKWCVVDPQHRVYCIRVTDYGEKPKWSVDLQVQMPEDYPSLSPPIYQLICPWMRGEERTHMENELQKIYIDNLGECIIFKWVDEIQNILSQKADNSSSDTGSSLLADNETKDVNIEGDVSNVDISNIECPVIYHGEPITERRSTFQAHLAPLTHKCQVTMVMEKLMENKKIANASHNILAYRLASSTNNTVIQGCDDDGEVFAGSRILHLLQIIDANNLIVVISRWFGGILLGPERFKIINNCARQICDEHGYIKVKPNENKHSRKSKKTKS